MAYGFIYIAENDSMPDLVKIGCTTLAPSERLAQLSRATGVPTKFSLYCAWEVANPQAIEKEVHESLSIYRATNDREFFRVPPYEAYKSISEWLDYEHLIESLSLAQFKWMDSKYGKN